VSIYNVYKDKLQNCSLNQFELTFKLCHKCLENELCNVNERKLRNLTSGNWTSRKTKITMAIGCYGRSKQVESKKLEGDS